MYKKFIQAVKEQTEARAARMALTPDAPDADQTAAETRIKIADKSVLDAIAAMESTPAAPAELRERVNLSNYVGAAIETRAVRGAELELNQEMKIPENRFPLELLAPVEERATVNVDTQSEARPWLDRLFADTAAMAVGIDFQSVPTGVVNHPVTTAGASAAQRGRKQAAADTAFTVGVTDIKPTRNALKVIFSEEDAARLPGLEDALRRDLNMALTEGLDRAIFLGDAGANEDRADITGLATATGVTELTLTQAHKVEFQKWLAAYTSLLDGKHASKLDDLGIVLTVAANVLLVNQVANADASNETVAEVLYKNRLMWSVRGDIEDSNTAAADWGAFIGRKRNIQGAGVAAVWNSGQLIRDHYSKADSGEVVLNLCYLWGLKFPRPSSFARLKFVA